MYLQLLLGEFIQEVQNHFTEMTVYRKSFHLFSIVMLSGWGSISTFL